MGMQTRKGRLPILRSHGRQTQIAVAPVQHSGQRGDGGFRGHIHQPHTRRVARTAVGDRYVIEEMVERNLNLGGEQSGHMIFRDFTTTGDGIISAPSVRGVMVPVAARPCRTWNRFTASVRLSS